MRDSTISLRPLASADLPLIPPRFEDPGTGRFLGGPEWPVQMLALAERYRSELRGVELFEAGFEPQNTARRHCLEGAGFEPGSARPDVEGMLYYRIWRRDLSGRGTRSL